MSSKIEQIIDEIEEFIDTRFHWLDHYLQDLAE